MTTPRRTSISSTPSSLGSLPRKPSLSSGSNGFGRGSGFGRIGNGNGGPISPGIGRGMGGATAIPLSRPGGRRLGSFNSLAASAVDPKSAAQGNLLDQEWSFWFLARNPARRMGEEEFGKAMRCLASCGSAEDLFSVYLHLRRPSSLPPISDLHFFIKPVKPVWEHPANISGGKWTIRLRKGFADRLWEGAVLGLAGGSLEEEVTDGQTLSEEKEVCGAVLSVRREEDLLAIWHRTGDRLLGGDGEMAQRVKAAVQTVLALPPSCQMAYKLNSDSIAADQKEKNAPKKT